jgi:hypothetical protein
MSRRAALPVVPLLFLALAAAAARGADAETVGDRGDPARMRVEGARAFPVEQLREAIDGDVQAQAAAAPSAPLAGFLKVIAERVRVGYVSRGFPDARVTAEADGAAGGGVVVRVREGPGYRRGGVVVEGAGPIPAAELERRLTSAPGTPFFNTTFDPDQNMVSVGMEATPAAGRDAPSAEDDDVPWEAGTLASFDDTAIRHAQKPVRRALAEMGFLWARFDLRVHRVDPPGGGGDAGAAGAFGEARLVVTVADPGPRAVLGRVEIEGLAKNGEASVRELCGLVDGMPLDAGVLQAVQQKLWDSARFKKHRLAARPSPGAAERTTLWIDLEELPEAPPLGEPFTAVEQAMLRCREYMANMARGPDDLVVQMRDPTDHVDLAMGFARGMAMRFSTVPADADAAAAVRAPDTGAAPGARDAGGGGGEIDGQVGGDGGPPPGLTPWLGVRLEPRVTALFDLAAKSRFTLEGPRQTVVVNVAYAPTIDDAGVTSWSFGFDAGLTNDDALADGPPVRLNLRLAPVAFIYLAHEPKFALELREGGGEGAVVESTAAGSRVRVDAATGRPLHFEMTLADGTAVVARAEAGGLRALADALGAGTGEAYEPAAPLGSAVRFVIGVLSRRTRDHTPPPAGARADVGVDVNADADADARMARAGRALGNLLTPAVTEPLDRVARELWSGLRGKHDAFTIPRTLGEGPVTLPGFVALFALPRVNDLFPRASWPWTVARELLLVTGGRPSQSAGEVTRVFDSPDTGPLGYLACAEALSRADAGGTAVVFAQRGLERLSAEDFARDWHALLGSDKAVPQFLARLVRRLGEVPPDDVDALAAFLPAPAAEGLRHVAAASRATRAARAGADDDGAALPKAVWEAWLGEIVERRLKELSAEAEKQAPDEFVF